MRPPEPTLVLLATPPAFSSSVAKAPPTPDTKVPVVVPPDSTCSMPPEKPGPDGVAAGRDDLAAIQPRYQCGAGRPQDGSTAAGRHRGADRRRCRQHDLAPPERISAALSTVPEFTASTPPLLTVIEVAAPDDLHGAAVHGHAAGRAQDIKQATARDRAARRDAAREDLLHRTVQQHDRPSGAAGEDVAQRAARQRYASRRAIDELEAAAQHSGVGRLAAGHDVLQRAARHDGDVGGPAAETYCLPIPPVSCRSPRR